MLQVLHAVYLRLHGIPNLSAFFIVGDQRHVPASVRRDAAILVPD